MSKDELDTREAWHHVRRFVIANIRKITRLALFLVLGFIALHLVHPASIEWLGERIHFEKPDLPSALSLAVVILLLERIFVLEEIVRTPLVRLYDTQEHMYRELAELVERDGAKAATLLQYSCYTCLPLVRALLESDATVRVYMQSSDTAAALGSSLQKRRIESHIETIAGELDTLMSRFEALSYSMPASVSAVRIDKDIIAVGWYLYLHIDRASDRYVKAGDTVKIAAHDVPGIVARRGSVEFETLNRLFERLLENYQANSASIVFDVPSESQ